MVESLALTDIDFEIRELGLTVASLMTTDMIKRRLATDIDAQEIMVPGLCAGDVDALGSHFGIPVVRGPNDLKDLPEFFGRKAKAPDLSRHQTAIFAEIVDAPHLDVAQVVIRATDYRAAGADVIDLGCLPGVDFPQMEAMIKALHAEGFKVSVDSMQESELLRAGAADADYLLSLREETLWIADEVAATPVLIPQNPGDMPSLYRAIEHMLSNNRSYFADAILDPVHFGLTESIVRYHELRATFADAPIMMGTGNLTELTDADTTGMTAILMGIASELGVAAILTTQVSPHAASAVREADAARRMLFAAKDDASLPRGYDSALLALRSRKPFPYSSNEIEQTAAAIKDPSFRIQLSSEGIHVFNRDGLHTSTDPFDLFPALGLEDDGAHAFYMGVELARAETAFELGKRYSQDQPLDWGAAVPRDNRPPAVHHAPGTTLSAARDKK